MKRIVKPTLPWRRTEKGPIAGEPVRNEYYENVSARFGIAQVVLYLSLLAFVVLAFLFNTELITFRNFYNFFLDLNASAERVDIFEMDSVSYPSSDEQSFAVYRKGLVVAGNHTVTMFSATGRQLLSESISYRNPVAVGTGKYLLVYEQGGTRYSLYNSNTCLYTGTCAYSISGAAVSDSGMYALVTADESATSLVSLYSNRFTLLNRYRKSGYVMSVAIDEKGDTLAILTANPAGGLTDTELMLAKPGAANATAAVTLTGTMGLDCTFTASGKVALLCEDGVRYVNKSGEIVEKYGFDSRVPARYAMSEDGIAVCLKKNVISEKNILIAFDKNGKMVYNETVTEDVEQLAYVGTGVFWMTNEGVWCADTAGGRAVFEACATAGCTLLAVSKTEAMCCAPQKAVYLSFRP